MDTQICGCSSPSYSMALHSWPSVFPGSASVDSTNRGWKLAESADAESMDTEERLYSQLPSLREVGGQSRSPGGSLEDRETRKAVKGGW